MNKKLFILIAVLVTSMLPSVQATGGILIDPNAAFFSGAVSFSAPIFVTNTNANLAVPRFSVINPVSVSGTVTTTVYSSVINSNTMMPTKETFVLTNRAINNTNLLKSVLGIPNVTGWSFGMISLPPDNLETSYPWNFGTAPAALVAYRISNNVIVEYNTSLQGFTIDFDLPEERHQRGRISFTTFGDLAGFSSTNFTTVYVSLPSVQLSASNSTPSFPEVKGMATFTNTTRSNLVKIPTLWGTNNWPVSWLGTVGGTAAGTVRGFSFTGSAD